MAAFPENLLRPGEHVRAHRRPHWRMLVVPALIPPVVAGLGGWLAAVASMLSWRTGLWVALVVAGVVIVAWFAVTPLLRWRCTHFVVTDRRLLVREGVLARASIEVVGHTVVAVRTRQTAAERLLGCGTMIVLTRGMSGEPWEFDGIGAVEYTAALVEEMAEERGGLVPDEAADDEYDEAEDADAGLDVAVRGYDEDDVDGWGAWDEPDARRRGSRISRRTARAGRTSR